MARGRGSAAGAGRAIAMAFAVACCCILAGCGVADAAATYYVGDGNGWSLSSPSWPNGKHFHAGDTLVFRYIPWVHNVVAVNEDGYNSCTTPPGSRTYTSGDDRVRLAEGDNFFICTRFGHCNLGMKLVVYAA
ncbi:basic blue protein-like [Phragmites australis]|uniref:basic blue protein-like n=1 Tax=Phragmites australis TaxID=29695 RepID=UPI002D7761C0|nr:basic blue protein-like [Phragmites australis]